MGRAAALGAILSVVAAGCEATETPAVLAPLALPAAPTAVPSASAGPPTDVVAHYAADDGQPIWERCAELPTMTADDRDAWLSAFARLAAEGRPPNVRCAALRCLSDRDDPRAPPLARRALEHAARGVQTCGIRVLKARGDASDGPLLRRFAEARWEEPWVGFVLESLGAPQFSGEQAFLRRIGVDHADDNRGESARRAWLEHHRLRPALAAEVLPPRVALATDALVHQDFDALARLVHPDHGLRFGINGLLADRAYVVSEVQHARGDGRIFEVGTFDGSGDSYLTSAHGFIAQLNPECLQAPDAIGYDERLGRGRNDSDGMLAWAYPDGLFAQLMFDGDTARNPGMWSSILLLFAPYGDAWMLTAVLEDGWTI